MTNKTIALVALSMLLGTISMAGGDIAPVEDPIEAVYTEDESGPYLGLGVASMRLKNDFTNEKFSSTGIMLQAGYQFNAYIAVEGRYTVNVGDLKYRHGMTRNLNYNDYPGDFYNLGIYAKPMISYDDFSFYALLGYGEVTLTDLPQPSRLGSVNRAESGFQWGLGAAYTFMDDVSVSVDYVKLYDDKGFDHRAKRANINSHLWTLAVSYAF